MNNAASLLIVIIFSFAHTFTANEYFSYDDVTLDIQSNSPVVVGSILTFHAALQILNHSFLNESFVYIWMNNAVNGSTSIFDITTTSAGPAADLSKVFSVHVLPGQYLMQVQVFRKQDGWLMAFKHIRPLAVGFHNFTLTETLNVKVSYVQLGSNTSDDVYLAGIPIVSVAHVDDIFQDTLWYQFIWYIDSVPYCKSVNKSYCLLTFNSAGIYSISFVATALVNVTTGVESTLVKKKSKVTEHHFLLKECITDLHIEAKHRLSVNESFFTTVLCKGSPPFRIHWNISRHRSSSDDLHVVDTSVIHNKSMCYHDIQHQFHHPGNYVVAVSVDNGVSQAHIYYNLSVDLPQNGRNVTEPDVPVYLPIFSVIIAISAFSAILWSFFYHRHSIPEVEEANFEFYRVSIQGLNYRQQEPVTIKMVARKAKLAWGFWRIRAFRKMRDVLWHPSPPCDENEMQDVTQRLLPGMRSYNSTGTTVVNR